MQDYERFDALGLADLVRRGEVDASELLDAARERIERHDPAFNAVTQRHYDLAEAQIAAGLAPGPFTGVPYLLKDLDVQLAGTVSTRGSALFRGAVAERDSELVVRLRAAGLVIAGKTASPEFGLTTTTESKLNGVTRNPWNRERSPGGSSGGSAVAVACGMVPMAQASDGGGSIRLPASCCGLFGLKPTRARVPMGPQGAEAWAGMTVWHAITRSVRDSAALLDATCAWAPGDPYCAPAPRRPYLQEVGARSPRLRIALRSESFNGAPTDPICREAAEDAARLCESLGHAIVEAPVGVSPQDLRSACGTVIFSSLRADVLQRAEELGRALSPEDVEPLTWRMIEIGAAASAADYVRAVERLHRIGRQLDRSFEACDVILTPAAGAPPPALGVLSLSQGGVAEFARALSASTAYSQLMNASGVPAMSVPLYWAPDGMPIGVQFAARFGREDVLLRLAAQLEEARPWFDRRPLPLAG